MRTGVGRDESVVGRQGCLGVGTGEMDRAGIAGGDVAKES